MSSSREEPQRTSRFHSNLRHHNLRGHRSPLRQASQLMGSSLVIQRNGVSERPVTCPGVPHWPCQGSFSRQMTMVLFNTHSGSELFGEAFSVGHCSENCCPSAQLPREGHAQGWDKRHMPVCAGGRPTERAWYWVFGLVAGGPPTLPCLARAGTSLECTPAGTAPSPPGETRVRPQHSSTSGERRRAATKVS